MDPEVYRRLASLEKEVQELRTKDYATYNTIYTGSQPTDHFFKPTLDAAWSWVVGAPYGGVPAGANLTRQPSHLAVFGTAGVSAWHYLSRSGTGFTDFAVRLIPNYSNAAGMKVDDGTENNYIYWYHEPGTVAGLLRLRIITRIGGGAPVQTILVEGLPYHPITLTINISGSGSFVTYHLEPHLASRPSARHFVFLSPAFVASRVGILFNPNAGVVQNSDVQEYYDWWNQQ